MFLRNSIDWAKARLFLTQAGDEANRLAAEFMADRARFYAPVKTGALKASIEPIKASGSGNYHVVCKVSYAEFVEWGFTHSSGLWIPPNPFMRRALADTQMQYPSIAKGVGLSRPGSSNNLAFVGATFG
jgi:hypothetical protein